VGRSAVTLRLPNRCLIVLVGTSGAGKTTWADAHFPGRVVSTDRLRALVGEHQDDQRAGTDAFAVLDLVVERRLKRGLLTVVDSLALNTKRRQGYVAVARKFGVPVHAVVFDTDGDVCRARLRDSGRHTSPSVSNTTACTGTPNLRATAT